MRHTEMFVELKRTAHLGSIGAHWEGKIRLLLRAMEHHDTKTCGELDKNSTNS
jgi:hypothetical protein